MTRSLFGPLRGKKRMRNLEEEAIESLVEPDNLPKEFDYYCPSCLYQTNEFSVICPKCGHEGLKESGEGRFRRV